MLLLFYSISKLYSILFLLVVTLIIYGIQFDIQAAAVINSQTGAQISFQHIYFARVNAFGSDVSDQYANVTVNNPCSPNPCSNQGLCTISINFTSSCTCSALWGG